MKIQANFGIQDSRLGKSLSVDGTPGFGQDKASGSGPGTERHGDTVSISAEGMQRAKAHQSGQSVGISKEDKDLAGKPEGTEEDSKTVSIDKLIKDIQKRIKKLQQEIKEIQSRQDLSAEQKDTMLKARQQELAQLQGQLGKLMEQKLKLKEGDEKGSGGNGGTAATTAGAAF